MQVCAKTSGKRLLLLSGLLVVLAVSMAGADQPKVNPGPDEPD